MMNVRQARPAETELVSTLVVLITLVDLVLTVQ